jgi:DNA-binding CsgD family transcriptional regulator
MTLQPVLTPVPGERGKRPRGEGHDDPGREARLTSVPTVEAEPAASPDEGHGAGPRPVGGSVTLHGRRRERQQLDELLHALRTGRGQALVVRGPSGIGKTALLNDLAERAGGCRTIRVAGVRAESRIPYAGLHQLCLPALDRINRLPAIQAEALQTAFGAHGVSAPHPLLVGLGLLSLLAELAGERPLLCLVDDAQWLDPASAQALGLAVRRLASEPIAVVVGLRDPANDEHLVSLPDLPLGGLGEADAGAVLDGAVAGALDGRVRARVLAEARGNPGALRDALRGLAPEAIAGGLGLAQAPSVPGRNAKDRQELDDLPAAARRLLLIAALEPLGDPAVVLRAARGAGLDAGAAAAAIAAGLIAIGGLIRFRDPNLRRVIRDAATPQERHDAHRALADAIDAGQDPVRAAWHRGHATAWPDEDVAAGLEGAAACARAQANGATTAALLHRAVELTPDPAAQARRALTAAEALHDAGAEEASLRMLAAAETGPLGDALRPRTRLLRARITHKATRGDESAALLLDAAERLRADDAALATDAYREALLAAISAGTLARGRTVGDVAAAIARTTAGDPSGDPLLAGVSALVVDGYGAAAPTIRRALAAPPTAATATVPALLLGCVAARAMADDAAWEHHTTRLLALARRTGTLSAMPTALGTRLMFELLSGDLGAALERADELRVTIATTGARASLDPAVWLAAWRGRADEALALSASRRPDAIRRGNGQWLNLSDWLCAMALNGVGRYEEALACAGRASGHPFDVGFAFWLLPELIEAAVRSEDVERAREPTRRLAALATATGTDWALGLAARCEALLDLDDHTERRYREALARLGRTRIRSALARTHLLYGEWLRRQRRRVDAREHLRIAHEMLAEMGAEGFAERTRRELIATGETVRRRSPETLDDLTPQEAEIARLAASGQTNREIGAQLFLSPRTVEWHLRKVFGKLGVSSRKALSGVLAGAARP